MRIVGEDGAARGRAGGCRGEDVRCAPRARAQPVGVKRMPWPWGRFRRSAAGARPKVLRNRPVPPRLRPARRAGCRQPVGIAERERSAGAQHLLLVVLGQLQGHHQRHGDGVGRSPRRDLGLEQESSGAPRPSASSPTMRIQAFTPAGIGLERAQRLGLQRGDRRAACPSRSRRRMRSSTCTVEARKAPTAGPAPCAAA
jgi:hypothetical protein